MSNRVSDSAKNQENPLAKQEEPDEDGDIVSHYGSIADGTFVSRRERHSGRARNIHALAKELKELDFGGGGGGDNASKLAATADGPKSGARRPNTTFHHFRFLVVMLAGVSVGLMMLMRYSMTISILKMVNQTHLYLAEHPDKTVEDFLAQGYTLGGDFNWNNEIVAIILSWYMFSYTLPQVPMARLAARLGCRLSVALSLGVCALASLLTPWCAYRGWQYVVAMRLLNGLGASAVQPMLLHTVETWMRYDEISLGLSISQTLNTLFITLTPLVAGYLAAIHWSYSFYVPALFTLAFCLLWYALISDGPHQSGFLSEREFAHITQSETCAAAGSERGTGGGGSDHSMSQLQHKMATQAEGRPDPGAPRGARKICAQEPQHSWVQILRVPSFYAHVVMWCLCSSSYSGFVFVLPTYMQQFLKLDVAQTGLICFLIQLGSIISVLWPHPLVRWLETRARLSLTNARIIGQSICCLMVASTWLYVGLLHQHQSLVLFLNRCFQGGSDVIVVGALMSNYARAGLSSVAFSLVNTAGHLSIVACSTLIGWLLDYTGQSRAGWAWIYVGLGLSEALMWLTFTFFIDSEPVHFKPARKVDAEGGGGGGGGEGVHKIKEARAEEANTSWEEKSSKL